MASKRFPVDQIQVAAAAFGGSLWFNAATGTEPHIDYGFGLHLAPTAAFNDGRATSIRLESMQLPARDWRGLLGAHPQPIPSDDCSIYVAGVHTPIDVHELVLVSREGARFDAEFSLLVDFEFGGPDYRNVGVRVRTDCEYRGLSFYAPEPGRTFPDAWNLPEEYTPETVAELFSRFVDLDRYEPVVQDGRSFRAAPRLN